MASTFTRINAVTVFGHDASTDTGTYPDPQLTMSGSYSSNLAQVNSLIAQAGQMYRGMPAFKSSAGYLVPPSASGARCVGVLTDDITAYLISKTIKITFQRRGRVRTYAGAMLTPGSDVKADTSASFAGVIPWVAGTDAESLKMGQVWPLDDGSASNGQTVTASIAQGDQVFLDLRMG